MSRSKSVYVDNLCIYKHGIKIIDNISVEAYEGDVVCIFGSTGSGKTTFLKTLAGLTQSLYNKFKVYGNISIYGHRPEEAVIRGLTAYVPQDIYSFFIGRTSEEELATIGISKQIPIDLGFDIDKDIYELSDGQLYRLLIASAVAGGAKVIAVDEPSSYIDWWSLEDVLGYLRDFVLEKNIVIFIADHRIDKIKRFCCKYVILNDISDTCSLPRIVNRIDNNIVVSLEDVGLCYNDNCVLRNVSMEVRRGDTIAIVGRNGVGKTTLLKVIAGLVKPSRGRVRFYGEPRIFMVPQNPVYWFPNESLGKVVELFIDILGVGERVDDILSMFKLDRYRDFDVYSLSVGLARVLSIALAYTSRADIVLVDEPTLGLDCRSKHMVVEAINKLANRGCSVVIATHDIDFAKLFNKIYVLDGGVLRIVNIEYS